MGFRFRKSIKIFPGIRVNLSKSGITADYTCLVTLNQ